MVERSGALRAHSVMQPAMKSLGRNSKVMTYDELKQTYRGAGNGLQIECKKYLAGLYPIRYMRGQSVQYCQYNADRIFNIATFTY